MSGPEILKRARLLVEPVMEGAVDGLCSELGLPARYHLGWAEADGSPSAVGAGKGLRPALAVLSAEAVGAPGEVAVPGAVAVELVHNFSLIHDDIIDGDVERRHRATVWAAFGTDDAIISGDALHNLAFQVLLADPTSERVAATVRLARATSAMLAGQAADMAFDDLPVVGFDDCLSMEADKTGALLGCAASIGAVLAGATETTVEALDSFGQELGVAFQAIDDVLGIWGNPEVTGKAAGNDLRERKKSMPVAVVLSGGATGAADLADIYNKPGDLTDDDVARATAIIEAAGGRERTEAEAASRLESALDSLDALAMPSEVDAEIRGLARFAVERSF